MHYCSQEKELVLYAYVLKKRGLVFYSFQDKGTGALSTTVLRIGERNRCTIVIRRKKQVHYCSQEKETGALLFSGEGTGALCLCFEEKGTGVLQFS